MKMNKKTPKFSLFPKAEGELDLPLFALTDSPGEGHQHYEMRWLCYTANPVFSGGL